MGSNFSEIPEMNFVRRIHMKAAGCDAPTGLTNVPTPFVTVKLETYSQITMKVILTTFIYHSNFLLCLELPWRHCLLQSSCMLDCLTRIHDVNRSSADGKRRLFHQVMGRNYFFFRYVCFHCVFFIQTFCI